MNQFLRNTGLLAALCSAAAWSVEIEQVSVVKSGKNFVTEAAFLVEAPRDAVVRAITDFDRLSDLNPAVVSSSAETLESGEIRVTTKIRDCVSFFCRSVILVEDVRFDAAGNLLSQVVPEGSDFAEGNAIWRFDTNGATTRVSYKSEVRPNFWLPPLLGSAAFRHALGRQIRVAASTIEALATPGRLADSSLQEIAGGELDQSRPSSVIEPHHCRTSRVQNDSRLRGCTGSVL